MSDISVEAGEAMYQSLCRACIARILSADANCEPQLDVMLRLESIIREHDCLRADAVRYATLFTDTWTGYKGVAVFEYQKGGHHRRLSCQECSDWLDSLGRSISGGNA